MVDMVFFHVSHPEYGNGIGNKESMKLRACNSIPRMYYWTIPNHLDSADMTFP